MCTQRQDRMGRTCVPEGVLRCEPAVARGGGIVVYASGSTVFAVVHLLLIILLRPPPCPCAAVCGAAQ